MDGTRENNLMQENSAIAHLYSPLSVETWGSVVGIVGTFGGRKRLKTNAGVPQTIP